VRDGGGDDDGGSDRVPSAPNPAWSFHWQKQPLSGTGVRATYLPDGGAGLLVLETDGLASAADAAFQDVTARLLAERFVRASVWCATTERAEYAGGQAAEPPAPGTDPPPWYT
jgi:hypothetical protein